jgi:hypothetical protein
LAKNLAKSGGILSRKRKVVVFREFCTKSGGFMLLTLSGRTSSTFTTLCYWNIWKHCNNAAFRSD